MLDTLPLLLKSDFPPLRRGRPHTLQVNLGYRCNQQCLHCHVNAGPQRKEMMTDATLERVLAFLERAGLATLDITGGAPELHPRFRDLVREARRLGLHVMDRCNLTVLLEPGQEDTAEFLAQEQVEIIASLPCYLEDNVDRQRGAGVHRRSLEALGRLNALGYGQGDARRRLNLVYNPGGAYLPPSQAALEADYKRELWDRYGVRFDRLLTLTNLPVSRFGSALLSKGEFQGYLDLLRSAHREDNLARVMCLGLLSLDWRGRMYDCDFNQMLGLPLGLEGGAAPRLEDLGPADLEGNPIRVAEHCYGCTAGQGSSCGGALS